MIRQLFFFIVFAFSVTMSTAIFWPGFMSDDSFQQLREALSGSFTSDHPAPMSWVWSQLLLFSPREAPQASILIAHQLLFFSSVVVFSFSHYPRTFAKHASILSLLVFYPPLVGFLGNTWKDIGMLNCLFLSASLLSLSVNRKQLRWAAIALPFMIYASAVRHNAPLSLFPLCVYWAFSFLDGWSSRKKVALGISIFVSVTLVATLWGKALTDDGDKHFLSKYTLFDLAGISYFSGEVVMPEYQQPRTLEDIKRVYNPKTNVMLFHVNSGNPLDWPDSPEEIEATTDKWWWAVRNHPFSYLKHRLKVSAAVLGMTTTVYYPYHMNIRGGEPNFLDLPFDESSLQATVRGWVDSISQSIIFRGWLYVLGNILVIIWLFKVGHASRLFLSCLNLSGLFSVLMLLPMTGAGDFRYIVWSVLSLLLSLFSIAFKGQRAR